MTDILTLAQARAALGWSLGQYTDRDADLTAVYIPLVTELIESPRVVGPLATRTESWAGYGDSPLTTPYATVGTTVRRVWVYVGATLALVDSDDWSWTLPALTITDSRYDPDLGAVVEFTSLPTPQRVVMAAKVTLKSVWNQFEQGTGTETRVTVPATADPDVLLPPLAWKLTAGLRPSGGFA